MERYFSDCGSLWKLQIKDKDTSIKPKYESRNQCFKQWLELALKDTFQDIKSFLMIDEILVKVYYLYQNLSKRLRELKGFFNALGEAVPKPSKAHKPLWSVYGTHNIIEPHRFKSHDRSTWGIYKKVGRCIIPNAHCYSICCPSIVFQQRNVILWKDYSKFKNLIGQWPNQKS